MDANIITQLVGSLGAPIVFAGALLWKSWKDSEKHEAEIKMLNDQHSADLKEITTEIHQNNVEVIEKLSDVAVALTKLADRMGAEVEGKQ